MENFIEGIVPLLRHKPKMKSVVTNYVPLRNLFKANIKAIHFRCARRMVIFKGANRYQKVVGQNGAGQGILWFIRQLLPRTYF